METDKTFISVAQLARELGLSVDDVDALADQLSEREGTEATYVIAMSVPGYMDRHLTTWAAEKIKASLKIWRDTIALGGRSADAMACRSHECRAKAQAGVRCARCGAQFKARR
jgi:hypothetical protein